MIIHFSIHFNTSFGQNLYILGSSAELGANDASNAIPLDLVDNFIWKKEIRIIHLQDRVLSYKYLVRNSDGSSFYEVGEERKIALNSNSKDIYLQDQWQGNTPVAPFLSAPFSDVFFTHKEATSFTDIHKYSKELIIRVTVPNIDKNSSIYLCGDDALLGGWNPDKALKMSPIYGSKWEIHLHAGKLPRKISYKFIKKSPVETRWEECDNHVLEIPPLNMNDSFSIEHSAAGFPISSPKFYGTAIPVFSLRSKNSCGVGDFLDLKLLSDWASSTGQNIIQILPINDTTSTGTWTDSYPYGAITVNALHPIYLNIREVGPFDDPEVTKAFNKECKTLNALKQIDYERVINFKKRYIELLFHQYSEDTFSEPDFYTFYKANKRWLLPYCAFCTLRDIYGTADFSKWGKNAVYSPALVEKINTKGSKTYRSMSIHLFTQYHLHHQLSSAVKYAHSKGIALKGDIPIGITPQSVDAWTDPSLFNMDSQAGAPPDDFSANGQNWGFPTYNWEEMQKDHYLWWKLRFSQMSKYFDAYRIDHVLGFFRIWEIPQTQTKGLLGHFNPALPFSADEMRSYGFNFDYTRDAEPYIRYYMLKEMFGPDTDMVINTFLDSPAYEVFTLKEAFNTQRKIEDFFKGEDNPVKDGLQALVGEVLFVEDPIKKGKFHPRISAQFTYSFKALEEWQKRAFNSLYDDFFYHRHNDYWRDLALMKLPELISATNMLACAEDLGMIPDCVPDVIHRLRIISLEIQRMPKDPHIKFGDPHQYPYLSVCTTGTHDTSTLRGWWEENRDNTQLYYNTMLHENGVAPQYCEPWICEKIIREHITGNSIITILPLQDWLSIDGKIRAQKPDAERINIPANPKHYWRYRMHISLEDLIASKEFNQHLTDLIHNK